MFLNQNPHQPVAKRGRDWRRGTIARSRHLRQLQARARNSLAHRARLAGQRWRFPAATATSHSRRDAGHVATPRVLAITRATAARRQCSRCSSSTTPDSCSTQGAVLRAHRNPRLLTLTLGPNHVRNALAKSATPQVSQLPPRALRVDPFAGPFGLTWRPVA